MCCDGDACDGDVDVTVRCVGDAAVRCVAPSRDVYPATERRVDGEAE
jgi:hypothetical protein